MSESNDAPPPQPPDEPPASSPFPESSLTPPPLPPQEEPPPPAPPTPTPASSEPPPPVAVPTPAPPAPAPPATPEPESRPWMESPTPPAPSQPMSPPTGGGLVSGDPLGGSTPAPADFPPGYTSPPPPGAGGFGSSASTAPAPGTYVLASWGRRVGAFVIDALVLMIPFFLLVSILGIGFFGDDEGADDGFGGFIVGFLLTSLAFLVVALLYAPVMMSRTNGKTLGRMATGIRVVRASGEPITFGFAAMREIVVKGLLINGVGGAVTFGLAWLIDSLWPLWDDENRALHDFVVNTRTVMDD